jgi:hypothetical protein
LFDKVKELVYIILRFSTNKGDLKMLIIKSIQVQFPHPIKELNERIDGDSPQIYFPNDWQAWIRELEQSLIQYGGIALDVSSTGMPGTKALTIRGIESPKNAWDALWEGQSFGIIANTETLKKLHAVIGLCIAASE